MIPLPPAMPGRRFKPSGRNVKENERHTSLVKIRCSPELASKVRALCSAQGVTLADVLEAGLNRFGPSNEEETP